MIWHQLYHFIHSMDQNFIDPLNYEHPDFHTPNMNMLAMEPDGFLSREQLYDYYKKTAGKIDAYLNSLDDEQLEKTVVFRGMELTGMELILAQFRHIFFHIGYLHCCIKLVKGETPDYVGLYVPVPE